MKPSRALLAALALWLPLAAACAGAHNPPTLEQAAAAAHGWPMKVDWAKAGDEAAEVLSAYLQVKTINPPGNETLGAEFLAGVLKKEGIDSEIIEFAPGRGSLVARLKSGSQEPGLCLMSHIDVVPATAENWKNPSDPFSGRIDEDGIIWGRGALDMKVMGVLELMTFLWLKRLNVPLARDVVFVAVADEEVDNKGVIHLAEKHWKDIGCSHVVNEGGMGIKDAIFEGQDLYTISVGEKGNLWLKVTAHGKAGHGSVVHPNEAIERLLKAIRRLEAYDPDPSVAPAFYTFFASVGEQRGGIEGSVLASKTMVDSLVVGDLMADPLTQAAITNTLHITGLRSPEAKPNVVPSEASVILDCRLLPGVKPEDMQRHIEQLIGDDLEITYEVLLAQEGNVSPVDDPFYRALERHAAAGRPGAAVGPVISIGSTDNLLLRPIGVRAYGFVPVLITKEQAVTMHGPDEHISVENVRNGLRTLFGAVAEYAGRPAK